MQATLPNSAAHRREFSLAPAPVHTLLSCSIPLQKPTHLHEPVRTLISPNPRFHSTCRFLPCLPLAWILAVRYVIDGSSKPKAGKKCVKPRNAGLDPENWGSTQESWNLFGLSSLVSQIYFCCVFNCFFLLSIVDGKLRHRCLV
jgi:hypothetical protein